MSEQVPVPEGHPRVVNICTDRTITHVKKHGFILRSESMKGGFVCDGCEQFKAGGHVSTERDGKRVRLCYPCYELSAVDRLAELGEEP